MRGYYATRLSGERLRRCYALASPRVLRYLEAEIEHTLSRLEPADRVLELGSGYGRVAFRLAAGAGYVVGIDNAFESVALARRLAAHDSRCSFAAMDATALAFREATFDRVVCVQNGICAFGVAPGALLDEALRVLRPGGRALFSTYAAAFWPHRLDWFRAQAAAGLVGEIDEQASGHGTIVCRDGFRAGAMAPDALRSLCRESGIEPTITTVDGSSVFCEIRRPGRGATSDERPGKT